MISAPIVNILARGLGMRSPMMFGAIILGGGFVSASFATRVWHHYLTQGGLVGLGVGFIYIPSVPVLSQWLSKKRILANGINSAGSGVGGIMFSLVTGPMIRNIGLGWSRRIVGFVAFVTNIAATLLIRD